jgi:hypothetical protein
MIIDRCCDTILDNVNTRDNLWLITYSNARMLLQYQPSHKKHILFNRWTRIFQACYNPDFPAFPTTGAKGIKMDQAWFSFEEFISDVGMPLSSADRLMRIDPNSNYTKSNCYWQSAYVRRLNKDKQRLTSQEWREG